MEVRRIHIVNMHHDRYVCADYLNEDTCVDILRFNHTSHHDSIHYVFRRIIKYAKEKNRRA